MFLIGFCSVCAQVHFVFVLLFVPLALLKMDHFDTPKMHQIDVQNRSGSGADFRSILVTDFAPFWLPFGSPKSSQNLSSGACGHTWGLSGFVWFSCGPLWSPREQLCVPFRLLKVPFWPLQHPVGPSRGSIWSHQPHI